MSKHQVHKDIYMSTANGIAALRPIPRTFKAFSSVKLTFQQLSLCFVLLVAADWFMKRIVLFMSPRDKSEIHTSYFKTKSIIFLLLRRRANARNVSVQPPPHIT